MTLTRKQKNAAVNAILVSVVVCVLGVLCWAVVSVVDQSPATAQPGIRTVNTQRYEKINLGDDGTADHYCLGTTGIWVGPVNGDFSVMAGDPQCR